MSSSPMLRNTAAAGYRDHHSVRNRAWDCGQPEGENSTGFLQRAAGELSGRNLGRLVLMVAQVAAPVTGNRCRATAPVDTPCDELR
jgi:hypothetical protein